ncbi:tRNA adenosine(34) deaminase TadA [Spongorhabdus nitratireducens]
MTIQKTDQEWMAYAMQLAAKGAEAGEVPVGAVIVHEGKIIGEGWNAPISNNDPTAHAEITALRQAAATIENYRLSGCTLYVTLEPCTMCAGSLIHSRIDRLVYGTTEPKAGAVVSMSQVLEQSHMNHQVEVTGGVLADECSEQLSAFFRRRRAEKKALKRAAGSAPD